MSVLQNFSVSTSISAQAKHKRRDKVPYRVTLTSFSAWSSTHVSWPYIRILDMFSFSKTPFSKTGVTCYKPRPQGICCLSKKSYTASSDVVHLPRGRGHSIVKNTGGLLDSLRSGILVGKRYFGVLQKYWFGQ